MREVLLASEGRSRLNNLQKNQKQNNNNDVWQIYIVKFNCAPVLPLHSSCPILTDIFFFLCLSESDEFKN